MLHSPDLPNTNEWQPTETAIETLQELFLRRCIAIEQRLLLKTKQEKEVNINNFDSGIAVEDMIRDELTHLLPSRYSVGAGVVNDRFGKTCGDCDVVILNNLWFPAIKAGATSQSRRVHYPIEGVYAVLEVKQSLNYKTLDEAMEKLVMCHRLYRPHTFANRLVENRDYDGCFHGLTNPLYSAIIAVSIDDKLSTDDLVNRWFDINKSLKRLEVVRALCVVGNASVSWAFVGDDGYLKPALFMREDLFKPILPIYYKMPDVESAIYHLANDLLLHLYQSVLAAEDLAVAYGPRQINCKVPNSSDVSLEPDKEWMDRLNFKKDHSGKIVAIKKRGRRSR